ncbi:hypothetical protein M9458_020669, partial [Cirrhinus mrigala]
MLRRRIRKCACAPNISANTTRLFIRATPYACRTPSASSTNITTKSSRPNPAPMRKAPLQSQTRSDSSSL